MKNPQGALIFLILLISLLFLANTTSAYYGEMKFILFALAGLAGLAFILKLFSNKLGSDEEIRKLNKKKQDYDRAVAKLTAKQKKKKRRKQRK